MSFHTKLHNFTLKHHIIIVTVLSIGWLILFSVSAYSVYQNQLKIANIQQQRLNLLKIHFGELKTQSSELIDQQHTSKLNAFSVSGLNKAVDDASKSLQPDRLDYSAQMLNNLELLLRYDQKKFADAQAKLAETNQGQETARTIYLPILLYHKTPPDFDAQLRYLQSHGYTTVHMSEVASAFAGKTKLPDKPVVITFDDGFSDQLNAANMLIKHNMEATFYLITAGERSHWCIGIERRPGNCGDTYMNWTEVGTLAKNPLFEIGGHTVDHLNLPSYPLDVQTFEIVTNKQLLESHLGTTLTTFAYPYGGFNATTVGLVKQAGYATAVTTVPGTTQDENTPFALKRIRNALTLP